MPEKPEQILPITRRWLPDSAQPLVAELADDSAFATLVAQLRERSAKGEIPPFLPDLAQAEWADVHLKSEKDRSPTPEQIEVNPTLQMIAVAWSSLLALLDGQTIDPQPSPEILLLWSDPVTGAVCRCTASAEDLLALKIITEKLDLLEVAAQGPHPVGVIDATIDKAVHKGLLLSPPSKLSRIGSQDDTSPYLTAEVFTLQWHITHRCDLHCRHCYDRSDRHDVSYEQGISILDQMRAFCRDNRVAGQVSFSGGNPFLHPDFVKLYRAAYERNLNCAILGNPVSESKLDTILDIAKPAFFQVSLEGLEDHNDHIRGQGSYRSVIDFLDLLRKKGIYSMVMLTLTRANLDQVLPLAEQLRDRVDLFTFNRLAMVGEGSNLASPGAEEYRAFIKDYLEARKSNPVMGLKDSLINIELEKAHQGLFGGCTGYGCGAAFNFVSLLPDGQVHACRKFPSPIGDINDRSLQEIYQSSAAEAYRRGCTECDTCRFKLNCGGCLAVTYGYGFDPLKVKDPACFLSE